MLIDLWGLIMLESTESEPPLSLVGECAWKTPSLGPDDLTSWLGCWLMHSKLSFSTLAMYCAL